MKNAALFAAVGMLLWTILVALELIRSLSGLANGIVAASATIATLIQFIAVLSLLIFFFVFSRTRF